MTTKTGAFILIGSLTSAGLALLPFSTALAEDGTINVSAEVVATCNVVDISDLAFGEYDPTIGTDTGAIAGFSVTCSTHASVDVSLDAGGFPDGTQRQMSDGLGNELRYDLYQDESTQDEFVVGQATQINVIPTEPTAVPVYGIIPAGQFVQTGDYNDAVQISLDF